MIEICCPKCGKSAKFVNIALAGRYIQKHFSEDLAFIFVSIGERIKDFRISMLCYDCFLKEE